ncbi:uncharacterized protein LOC106081452 [Stomoxys calcitrans]|uniref:uncharacterized protein LOC106081452 n=1 Tax=Stomoxys calcitrans TaxID=35570 RepID=UPI0027E2FE5D|nr:uncharacterized protein LOC106081452 [Stomoxys calcitrans]
MIITPSLIGGWDKLELWDHTPALLIALLVMVCTMEVVLWKMTNSLFTRSNHFIEHAADYTGSDEYEDENIYYEHLSNDYDRMVYQRQREQQRQMQNQTTSSSEGHQQLQQYSNSLQQQYRHLTEVDEDDDDYSITPSRNFYPGHNSGTGVFRFFN